jgi:hypothetical protein
MRKAICAPALALTLSLGGCGTYVPNIQEFYESPSEAPITVANIIAHVQCEIKYAIQSEIIMDIKTAELRAKHPEVKQGRSLEWLEHYAAQITLNLTLVETGSINAGLSLNTPYSNAITNINPVAKTSVSIPQSSSVGLAASFSTQATRKETLSLFINFEQFTNKQAMAREIAGRDAGAGSGDYCNQPPGAFIQGDLKLKDWLDGALLPASGPGDYSNSLNQEAAISKKDVIQHEVTFVITYNGGITPSWKLVRVAANQGSLPFLFGQRVNTQDVIITIGPSTKGQLNTTAQNALLAAQIRSAVGN